MRRVHLPYWLFTLAYGGAWMLPTLVSEGTFLDGLIYAVLARNLAGGLGTFWTPHFSNSAFSEFHEHPPLGFGLESVFYRVFGDGYWVEHLYSGTTAVVTGWLIVVAWRWYCGRDREYGRLAWLPVLMWLTNSQVTWSYTQNMLENTMGIFTLGAVVVLVRSFAAPRFRLLPVLAAAVLVAGALLTKGAVGLFPLPVALVFALTTGEISWRRALAVTAAFTGGVGLVFAVLWTVPAARESIRSYLEIQFLFTMGGGRGDVANRFGIFAKLLNTLLPALGLTVLILVVGRFRRALGGCDRRGVRRGLFFLAVALSASLPLVVSPCQSLFYLVPSFPFFALALAAAVGPVMRDLLAGVDPDATAQRVFRGVTAVLLVAVLAYSATWIGRYNRDEVMVRDVKIISEHVLAQGHGAPDELRVAACRNLWREWGLEATLARYHNIGMKRTEEPLRWLISRGSCDDQDLTGYVEIPLATGEYVLYERQGP